MNLLKPYWPSWTLLNLLEAYWTFSNLLEPSWTFLNLIKHSWTFLNLIDISSTCYTLSSKDINCDEHKDGILYILSSSGAQKVFQNFLRKFSFTNLDPCLTHQTLSLAIRPLHKISYPSSHLQTLPSKWSLKIYH